MAGNSDEPPGGAGDRKQYQFSLRSILVLVTVLSLLLAIAAQFPRHSTFAALMTALLLLPLAVVASIRLMMVRMGLIQDAWTWQPQRPGQMRIRDLPAVVIRRLGLSHADNCPPLRAAFAVAVVSTLVVVGLWPVIREFGLWISVGTHDSEHFTLEVAWQSITEAFPRSRYWLRLWQWELWAVGRWWLLFGGILAVWLLVSTPFLRSLPGQRVTCSVSRLLAFAPWLIVLEMAFLIGVWVSSPNTVPEPSTGFVVGIFSWDLWHWDCWLNREWLVRGALPTLVAGYVFFARIIGWPRPVAFMAALLLIPVAIWLSVAGTVAYSEGFPWFQ
jgi:hypothetical protein